MALDCLKPHKNGLRLAVQAVPRASVTEIIDLSADRCKIKVKAPPVDGEANVALIEFLAKLFGLPKKQVSLDRGGTGRQKLFLLEGISLETAEKTLIIAYPKAVKGKGNT